MHPYLVTRPSYGSEALSDKQGTCEKGQILIGQRGGKSDVALTAEDETSNLLSSLGKRKGVEVVHLVIEVIHPWPHINKSFLPLSQLCPFFSLSARACAPPSTRPPPTLLSSSRCLSSWISF